MKVILLIYRIIYGAFLIMFLLGTLRRDTPWGAAAISEIIPFWLFVCALVFGIFAAFAFQRITRLLMWLGIILLCGLLTWFGWWSQGTPFALHELHTFDPVEAAAEVRSHNMRTGIGYAILLIWLMSLPVTRHFAARLAGSLPSAPK
jgi:hypothetical protein